MKTVEKIVVDTSAFIEGILSKMLDKKEISFQRLLIHEAALAELEHQANENKEVGILGLEEVKRLQSIKKQQQFEISFVGTRPRAQEIKYASLGEVDAMIRDAAYVEEATLLTLDKVQAEVAQAKGIDVILAKAPKEKKTLAIEKFFDKETMSVHLRENVKPHAKRGAPGSWEFAEVGSKKLKRKELEQIAKEIVEEANIRTDAFVEIERLGSTIVQLGSYRIVITKPPFADGWEITAVRPVKHMSLEEYNLSPKLQERIAEQAEGILIAGSPGMGKSTFAAALAEFYASQNRIVKTVEAPRDLVLPDEVTQLAISHGSSEEVHDILLLSRPDHTFFDEMRNTDDFKLFADLRLSGIGFIGVIHATRPIDAIQRFVGRIELGVIPQVVDTVIFIKNGTVDEILSLNMVVKVPSGMTESDLARPVVVVHDFETNQLEYELYSYGEETVCIPVSGQTNESPMARLAQEKIEELIQGYSKKAKVEMLSENKCAIYVPEKDVSKIIGKQGKRIAEIEKEVGISIDVRTLDDFVGTKPKRAQTRVKYKTKFTGKSVVFFLDEGLINQNIDIVVEGDYVMTAAVGKKAVIKVKKASKLGKVVHDAVSAGADVELMIQDTT